MIMTASVLQHVTGKGAQLHAARLSCLPRELLNCSRHDEQQCVACVEAVYADAVEMEIIRVPVLTAVFNKI